MRRCLLSRTARWTPALVAALGLATLGIEPGAAHAQEPNPTAARADELFREGKRQLDAGQTDAACELLAESQSLDPSSGTLLNLALCHEKQGRLATARAEYLAAARLARDQGREARAEAAESKATEILALVPRLTLRIQEEPDGLQVTRGGLLVPPSFFSVAVEVDVGKHLVEATAPGYKPFSLEVPLTIGETRMVDLWLEPEAPSAPLPATVPPPAAAPPLPPPGAETSSAGSAMVPAGWLVGGGSLVLLGVGAGFGVASLGDYDEAETLCPGLTQCGQAAVAARDAAETKAWVSNVAIGVGVVGVAVGVVLLVAAPSGEAAAARAWRAGPRGTQLGGTF